MERSTIFKNGKPSISIRAIYTMAMLNNQRVNANMMIIMRLLTFLNIKNQSLCVKIQLAARSTKITKFWGNLTCSVCAYGGLRQEVDKGRFNNMQK